jgi:hypothetical protein
MPVPYTNFTITYRWDCCAPGCGETAKQEFTGRSGNEIPLPSFPEGWRAVPHTSSTLYCPKHKVGLLVDGQVRPL